MNKTSRPAQPAPCAVRAAALRALRTGAALLACLAGATVYAAGEPAVTILTDFEDDNVAAQISDVQNIVAADCTVTRSAIPARGTNSCGVTLGATNPNSSAAVRLTFRETPAFEQLDRIAALLWITTGSVQVAYRIADADGQIFETAPQPVREQNRWVRIAADAGPKALKPLRPGQTPRGPFHPVGFRVALKDAGKQSVYLDELQVEHTVSPREFARGVWHLSEATQLYEPGATFAAALELENRSRKKALALSVELTLARDGGEPLQRHRASVPLPPSGNDYRSRQRVDFSHVVDAPGLYRLRAQVSGAEPGEPSTFETAFAVLPSNRGLKRGRSTFFGVGSNLLRESAADQLTELSLAHDIGANLVAIALPWNLIEPRLGEVAFARIDRAVDTLGKYDMGTLAILGQPPEGAAGNDARLSALLAALCGRYGDKLFRYQLEADVFGAAPSAEALRRTEQLAQQLAKSCPRMVLFPPAIDVNVGEANEAAVALAKQSGGPLLLRTSGATEDVGAALRAFHQQAGLPRRDRPLFWLHRPHPAAGLGAALDATDLLRHYVYAAELGASGLIWSDLRDDEREQLDPSAATGLVRRDFAPRHALLGFAGSAAQLTGLGYKGPVLNAPEEYDSAMFLGNERHLALLIPRPQRTSPLLLAPLRGIDEQLDFLDFERTARPLLNTPEWPLIATIAQPMFLQLRLSSPQPEPQIGLLPTWLRCPQTAYYGDSAAFTIELEPPYPIGSGYLQLDVPADAPFISDFSAAAARGEPGTTIRHTVRLKPRPGKPPAESRATLRVTLNDQTLEAPLRVLPLGTLRRCKDSDDLSAANFRLASAGSSRATTTVANVDIHGGWSATGLRLLCAFTDGPRPPAGSRLLIGVGRVGVSRHVELAMQPFSEKPALISLIPAATAIGGSVRTREREAGGPWLAEITLPLQALGGPAPAAGQIWQLAVAFEESSGVADAAGRRHWGGGLDGRRRTDHFNHLQLIE